MKEDELLKAIRVDLKYLKGLSCNLISVGLPIGDKILKYSDNALSLLLDLEDERGKRICEKFEESEKQSRDFHEGFFKLLNSGLFPGGCVGKKCSDIEELWPRNLSTFPKHIDDSK